jgi:hypothetical protein
VSYLVENVFVNPTQLWNDDPSMAAANFPDKTYQWKESLLIKDEHVQIIHEFKAPLYKFVPLEWEVDEIKNKKATGNKVWTMGSPRQLAQNLHATFPTLHFWKYTQEFYIQDHGYLRLMDIDDLNSYIMQYATHCMHLTPQFMDSALRLLKTEENVLVTQFEHRPNGVPFRNCIKGKNADKNHAFRRWHNINYVENAKLPSVFQKYIEKLVPNPKKRQKTYAYLCYLLHESKAIQQIFVLFGKRWIGKSELYAFIGSTIISLNNMDINHVLKDRGSETSMREVHACIFDEISSLEVDVKVRDQFKKWSTQKTINIRGCYETKALEDAWFGRVLMSTNELPYSQYIDAAYLSRICLIPCEKSFDKPIPDFVNILLEKADEIWSWIYDNYHEKMVEILGIRSDLTLKEYNENVNPFQQFMQTIEESADLMLNDTLYDHYCTFAGDTPMNKSEFGKKLKNAEIIAERKNHRTFYPVRVKAIDPLDGISDEELEELSQEISYEKIDDIDEEKE